MFIEGKKFKKLYEAAHNGDERAMAILRAYQDDDSKFSGMLEDYFAPKEEEIEKIEPERKKMSGLEKFLSDNNVDKSNPDYEEYVNDFNENIPTSGKKAKEEKDPLDVTELIDDETEAINVYNKFLNNLLVANISEAKKALITSKINKIREDEIQHISTLRELSKEIWEDVDL